MNPLNPDLVDQPRLGLSGAQSMEASFKKSGKKTFDDDIIDSNDDSESEKPSRRSGRRKIKIEYIEDKNRRHITFSKRKAGIMKKAYELSTLTGTQVLLLVVSETGLVYTFTTVKLQPIVTKPEGKNLIQACLNAPDPINNETLTNETSYTNGSPRMEDKKYEEKKVDPASVPTNPTAASFGHNNPPATNYPPQAYPPQSSGAIPVAGNYGHPGGYMNTGGPQYQPPQQPYGQMGAPFYGNQQQPPHHYMQHQQTHPNYWPASSAAAAGNPLPRQEHAVDEKARKRK
ncbi:hypothetical protein BDF14DRAFT_774330 [Spinellus fusiger]|nr:hypothetical protein BDF14DRAFT_774330 [Spinellus fusiger]